MFQRTPLPVHPPIHHVFLSRGRTPVLSSCNTYLNTKRNDFLPMITRLSCWEIREKSALYIVAAAAFPAEKRRERGEEDGDGG